MDPAAAIAVTQVRDPSSSAMAANEKILDADALEKEIAAKGRVSLYGIYFDSGKAEIKRESKPALDEVAKLLERHPDLRLVVMGHTDDRGSFAGNMQLSRQRAAAVRDKLVEEYGLEPDRLQPWGLGSMAPVDTNKTAAGRARNRRVDLVQHRLVDQSTQGNPVPTESPVIADEPPVEQSSPDS